MNVIVEYPFSATANGEVDYSALAKELAEAGLSQRPSLVRGLRSGLRIGFAGPVSQGDRSLLNAVVATHNQPSKVLVALKEGKLRAIKSKTSELIAAGGFEYPSASGKLFGLSEVSQLNITGAFNSRNAPSFAYPVVFFVKNDLDSVSLEDAAAVEEFHAAAVTAIRAIRDGGAALKAQVVAATTLDSINAIVDNR
jgi:hypothetical protein